MALWAPRGTRALRYLVVAACLGGVGLAGCGKQAAPTEQAPSTTEKQPGAPQADAAAAGTAPATPPAAPADAAAVPAPADGQHQPFARATRGGDDPPPECDRPPDT